MKYIVTENEDAEREIFIFPRAVHHSAMAEVVSAIRNQTHGDWRRIHRKPVSAGFVENGRCVGKSESLHLNSHPDDTALSNNSGASLPNATAFAAMPGYVARRAHTARRAVAPGWTYYAAVDSATGREICDRSTEGAAKDYARSVGYQFEEPHSDEICKHGGPEASAARQP